MNIVKVGLLAGIAVFAIILVLVAWPQRAVAEDGCMVPGGTPIVLAWPHLPSSSA
jgi:hypothetical protein